jgi:hypothetical protein
MKSLAARIRRCLSLGVAAFVLASSLRADDAVPNGDVTVTFANGKNSVIPCKFILNTILIPVPTPDKSYAYLIFDTGAGVPMISETFARKMRIRGSTEFPATGIGQQVTVGSVSTGITFSLSGLTFHNAHWALLPNVSLDASFGLPVVGVLGLDLLKGFVIRIDYATQTVEFIQPATFRPPGGDAVSLPLVMRDQGLMVGATVKTDQAEANGQFLFDTGNNGTLDLSKLFQDQHPELKFRRFAESGSSGVGGTLLTSEAICPALVLGGISVRNALVDLDQAVQGVDASMDGGIGNEIWRRFNVTIDMPNKKMYLQRNAHFSDPFSYVTAGMNVLASGNHYGTLTVHEILPGSAGEKAGFLAGDVIVKVDELGSAPLIMANVYPLLHRAGTSHFVVKRGGERTLLTLELKDPAS